MPSTPSYTAVIADDHEIIRTGLVGVIAQYGIEVLGQAGDGLQAVASVKQHQPDILFP